MNNIKELYLKVEKFLASAKFAVIIISIFTVALVIGTFQESYHGADYANRLIYKSWWFIAIEVMMFLSIFMATMVRLPAKKRLYGFYTIHSGLLILFIGSFYTYVNGIDGSIQLLPNTPAKKLMINEDLVRIDFVQDNKSFKLALPYTAFATNIDKEINGITLGKFLPSAELATDWKSDPMMNTNQHSGQFQIFNEMVSEEFIMSLNPSSDFKSMKKMGPLTLHYMPFLLKDCFLKKSKTGFIIWNLNNGECFTPEERKLIVDKTEKGTDFVLLQEKDKIVKFFPNFSPVPVNDDLTKDTTSPYRVMSKNLFLDKPNLFIFGEDIVYYKMRKKDWVAESLTNEMAKLPWMNFKLRLLKHSNDSYPVQVPKFTKPIQDNSEIIHGNIKALQVTLGNNTYWVRNDAPLALSNGKSEIRIMLSIKEQKLPYQLTLGKFKMNTNPGTKTPASYESFVQLLDGRTDEGVTKHHIYMNNPLKYDDFTFYQASYFPIGPEQYGSVLSVNYDPGRFLKYLGSLLIVLGSIWHYFLNRRKKKVIA